MGIVKDTTPNQYPDWLSRVKDKPDTFEINADVAYPVTLKRLGVASADQYWLEVAYQFIKLQAQKAIADAGADPRPERSLVLLMAGSDGVKQRWGQASHPEGHMAEVRQVFGPLADRACGRVARDLFREHFGYVPQ